jgi:putative spermidine/putrescine transport system permease protein
VKLSFNPYVPGEVIDTNVFTISNYSYFLQDWFYRSVLLKTLIIGLLVTLITLIMGYPVAYYVIRIKPMYKEFFMILLLCPLLISVVIRAYGWFVILGNEGIVNKTLIGLGLISQPIKLLFNSTAIVIGLVHALLPFMTISIMSVLDRIRKELEEAAQGLGANRRQIFLRVTIPLSIPGIVAGSVIVFSLSIAYYVTPSILGGGGEHVMATLVGEQVISLLNWPFGSAIATILMVIMFLIVFIINKILLGLFKFKG